MKPAVIAHRGASIEAPENTMLAFERAVDAGADMIELDVRFTQDGKTVVLHDRRVDRTTNGQGNVDEMSWHDLQSLLISGAEAHGRQERISLLSDVLQWARGKIGLNIEIKKPPSSGPTLAEAVAEAVDHARFPLDQLIISSFDMEILRHLESIRSDLALAPLFTQPPEQPEELKALPGTWLHPHFSHVNETTMAAIQTAGRRVNVWTVNDAEEQERLIALGVDGIITDDPRALRERLARR